MSWFATVAMVVAAGLEYKNTQDTAKRQDNQASLSILNQSKIQKQADSKVNDQVQALKDSTAAGDRATRLDDYMGVLRKARATSSAGLTPDVGSTAFKADSATAATGVQDYAGKTADLMSRIDAPQMQRQGEAFSYGNLASDIGGIARQSQGQNFIDTLRQNMIRRNAKIDLGAGLLSAYAGSQAGGGSGVDMGGSGTAAGVNSSGRAVAANPWG